MEEKIKNVSTWIRNNSRSSGFLGSFAAGIVLLIVRAMLGGITFKMVYETLINLDIFAVFGIIFLIIAAILGILLVKERYNDSISKVKLELEEKTEQYDELAKQVELPKAVDKAITVEKNPDWGILHPYKDIIQNRKGDKFPYLQFYMRVINRTYYYFEPDKMVICCLFDNHKLCDEWNSEVKTKETNIEPDNLRECEDGTIIVRFPIKELYGNLRKWKLDGTVTYKLKGSVIKANKQYMHPKIGIHVEYELPDEQIKKLKEEVEKALGGGR